MSSGLLGASRAATRASTLLRALERILTRLPIVVLGLVTGGIAVLKSGIDVTQVYLWPLDSWPDPAPVYPPLTYGFRLIAKLVGTESQIGYNTISVLAILALLAIAPVVLARGQTTADGRWITIVVMSGPVIWILSGGIGRTDPLVILAGLLLGVLGRSLSWSLLTAALAVLGNPEQAIVMSLCLLLVTAAPAVRDRRRGAIAALTVSTLAWIVLTLWSWSRSVPSRPDYFMDLWRQSLATFFVQLPLELYAGFGFAGVVIVWAMLNQRGWRLIFVAIGAVVIPLTITALTIDQTRVLVCCSVAAVTALVHSYGPSLRLALGKLTPNSLALTFIVTLALPAVELAATKVRTPWETVYPFIQAYVAARLTGS